MSSERASYDKAHGFVPPAECASMRLLAQDGWTPGELKMCFHISGTEGVARHVNGECGHELDEVTV